MKSFLKKFPHVSQHDHMDCGPACLAIISKYYGKEYSIQELREYCSLARDGVTMLGIEDGALEIGFETIAVQISTQDLIIKNPLPCILYWDNNHFVVLYKITKSIFTNNYYFHISDPAFGRIKIKQSDFEKVWLNNNSKGIALILNTKDSFFEKTPKYVNKFTFSNIINIIKPNKKEFFILLFGFLFSSFFTLIFPYLTQALIDIGISDKNLNYIFLILLAQLFLFFGTTIIDVVRSWVLMFVNSMINIQIIADFLNKIIKLPFHFFDTKQLGDFTSRIQDHHRIQEFLTSQSLIVVFSSFNFIIYFFVLSFYDPKILIIYLSLTLISIIWSLYFLKKIERLDYNRFSYLKAAQQNVFELVNGIVEIKLNNTEEYKVNKWQANQSKLFSVDFESLKVTQYQNLGFEFINQLKNILIIFIAAREVIIGNITLGTLLAISYIIGMMNNPLSQLIEFLKSWQFAKLSFFRLNEVQLMENEDNKSDILVSDFSQNSFIEISNLDFHYHGFRSPKVINNLSIKIPFGKTTAIVGESGSGKTTLMKLLLKFYSPSKGEINYSGFPISDISAKDLRKNCGVVMQDGYIFSDTLERNIATGSEEIDNSKLENAVKIANLQDYVDSLPQGYKTMLGSGGNGVSGGQKQRILIARAVYKNPKFIFFDEATSSLDAENEKIIYDNLDLFFKGKTVVKIAHRLSTVKNANQIIVIKKGKIVEIGNHKKLVSNKGVYYNLVKNQLELSV
ncbi:peptidase domain-containing ABC transporter [Tenacibaculum tangerinum]|uniref:Peptidase domain-containing ABC transporter n=1 Tax=Tenacibaculum tangerinum TaxID=3038772 RepID=A0ABY8L199_9FLAO|nr:peptidase domain-containing ABC transporter [Tenacibaculum tangerinum]WGH75236.1 peptidase domain-containing ABC transporter [Tenacibaculum tangerinum]